MVLWGKLRLDFLVSLDLIVCMKGFVRPLVTACVSLLRW